MFIPWLIAYQSFPSLRLVESLLEESLGGSSSIILWLIHVWLNCTVTRIRYVITNATQPRRGVLHAKVTVGTLMSFMSFWLHTTSFNVIHLAIHESQTHAFTYSYTLHAPLWHHVNAPPTKEVQFNVLIHTFFVRVFRASTVFKNFFTIFFVISTLESR